MTSRTGKIVSIRSRSRGGLKQLSQGARPRTIRCGARRQGDPEKRRGFTPLETFGGVQMKRASLTGFTLIELTLVAVIILVLVVLSSPKFRGTFTSLQIDDAAQRMAQVIRYGQHRAIVEERRFRLNLDNTRGVYRLLSESKDTDGGVSEGMAAAFAPGLCIVTVENFLFGKRITCSGQSKCRNQEKRHGFHLHVNYLLQNLEKIWMKS